MDDIRLKVTKPKKLKETVPLQDLYLSENLKQLAENLDRVLVYTSYVTDKNYVIALKNSSGPPKEIKNDSDWRLFQELNAQADVIITGSGYLKRVEQSDEESAQNVISQFSEGAEFADLGEWRLSNGFENRNPDIVIVSRSLDFNIQKSLKNTERKITVFTTHEMYESEQALQLKENDADVVAGGVEGVDGRVMIDHLYNELGYKTIMMATGPSVLDILLRSNVLDRLYITQVQREIEADDENKSTVLKDKRIEDLEDFELTYEYLQENASMDDGETANQYFRLYEHKKLLFQTQ